MPLAQSLALALAALAVVTVLFAWVALVYTLRWDARARDAGDATGWLALVVAFPPAALWYWVRRESLGERATPPSDRERGARAAVVAVVTAQVVSAVATPPDPYTQLVAYLGALSVTLVLSYMLLYRGGYATVRRVVTGG